MRRRMAITIVTPIRTVISSLISGDTNAKMTKLVMTQPTPRYIGRIWRICSLLPPSIASSMKPVNRFQHIIFFRNQTLHNRPANMRKDDVSRWEKGWPWHWFARYNSLVSTHDHYPLIVVENTFRLDTGLLEASEISYTTQNWLSHEGTYWDSSLAIPSC